jgi:hypothetical protein
MTRSATRSATRPSVTAQKARIPAAATLAAALTLVASAPALANDSPVFKKSRDNDITIIILDDKDRDQKRFVTEDKRKPEAATTFRRPDDEIRIRIPRTSTSSGSSSSSGPTIIIVDGNTDACKGSGVCVIRP